MLSFLNKISLLLFCIACTFPIAAQTPEEADSLLDNLYSAMPDDTNKVNKLYKTGFDLRTKDVELANRYADLCLTTALQTRSKGHIAKAYNLLGVLCFRTGKLDKALQYHNEALKLRQQLNDEGGMAMSQLNLGNVYSDQEKKQEAEKAYLEAMQLFNKRNDQKQVANCLNNIGILKFEVKDYNTAGTYFKRALAAAEELNDYELKAFTNNNLGTVYENLKDFKLAQAYFEEALELRELMDNEVEMADSYINIASTSFELEEVEKAKDLLAKALVICKKNDYAEGSVSVYNFLKDIYKAEGNMESALYYQKLYYEEKEKMLTLSVGPLSAPKTKTVVDDTKVHELKGQVHLLKYIIGVLAVFLVILVVAIRRTR
jgi:tetratricopeptide (TPR) repeat protein